jgi:hypothetical protein
MYQSGLVRGLDRYTKPHYDAASCQRSGILLQRFDTVAAVFASPCWTFFIRDHSAHKSEFPNMSVNNICKIFIPKVSRQLHYLHAINCSSKKKKRGSHINSSPHLHTNMSPSRPPSQHAHTTPSPYPPPTPPPVPLRPPNPHTAPR